MAGPQIAVQITGQNNLGPTLIVLQKQLAGVQRTLGHSQSQITKMTDKSKIDGLSSAFGKLSGTSFDFFKNVSRSVDAMGVLTGGSSIAGILALSRGISTLGQSQLNASRSLNIAPKSLVAWQNAAKAAGGSAEDATASIGGLETAVSDMKFKNSPANGFAQQFLGAGWQKKYKDDASLLIAISTKLQGLHGEAKRSAILGVEENFRLTSGLTENLLLRGPAYVQEQLARGAAAAPSDAQISNLDKLSTSFTHLENSITGAGEAAVSSIGPMLIPQLDNLSKWIDGHQKIVGDFELGLAGLAASMGAFSGAKILKNLVLPKAPPGVPGAGVPAVPGGAARPGFFRAMLGDFALPVVAAAVDAATIYDTFLHWSAGRGTGSRFSDTLGLSPKSFTGMSGNAAVVASIMKSRGAPDSFVAASLGNSAQESGINPLRPQDGGGPGFGMFQWEAERQARFKQLEGIDIHKATLAQETDFFMREMKSFYPSTYAQLMSGKLDTTAATSLLMRDYLAPKDKDDPQGSILKRTADALQFATALSQVPDGPPIPYGPINSLKHLTGQDQVALYSGPHSRGPFSPADTEAATIASSKAAFEAAAQLHDARWFITHPDETSGLAGDSGSDSGKLEVTINGVPSGVKATIKHTPTNGQVRRVTAMATAGGTAATGGF
jgi:Phage tail lysozyme